MAFPGMKNGQAMRRERAPLPYSGLSKDIVGRCLGAAARETLCGCVAAGRETRPAATGLLRGTVRIQPSPSAIRLPPLPRGEACGGWRDGGQSPTGGSEKIIFLSFYENVG